MSLTFAPTHVRSVFVAAFLLFGPLLSAAFAGGAPQFSEFAVISEVEGVWTAIGIVEDEDPSSCNVVFGGPFDGETAIPASDGYFEVSVQLDPGESGIVTAIAHDSEGLKSDEARSYIE